MKTQITFAALLPALASFIPLHAHASSTSEDEMIVTGNTAADTTDSAAGAGFKTNDIDVGPLGTKSWIETPYSSTTVTKEMIENQQAQSVSEMLKYSPSTQMQARGGMDVGRPQSRGMQGSVVANSRLDGLNIVSTTAFPVEMLERMDVLNSLTGALYGPASPAGQFNFVAKRPTEETLRKVTLGYQSRSAFTGHADLGGHFDENKRFGYRVNLLDQEGEGNVDDSTLRRKLVSVALDWNIQPGTQLQLDASHYEFIQKGYVGSFNYGPNVKLPSAPNPKDKNLALSTAGNDLTTDTISTRLIHYFNDDWSMNAGVGWQQADRAMRSVSSKILNNQGDISRSMKDSTAAGRFRVLSNTAGLNGHIDTGSHVRKRIFVAVKLTIASIERIEQLVNKEFGLINLEVETPHSREPFRTQVTSCRVKGHNFAVHLTWRTELQLQLSLSDVFVCSAFQSRHTRNKAYNDPIAVCVHIVPQVDRKATLVVANLIGVLQYCVDAINKRKDKFLGVGLLRGGIKKHTKP